MTYLIIFGTQLNERSEKVHSRESNGAKLFDKKETLSLSIDYSKRKKCAHHGVEFHLAVETTKSKLMTCH